MKKPDARQGKKSEGRESSGRRTPERGTSRGENATPDVERNAPKVEGPPGSGGFPIPTPISPNDDGGATCTDFWPSQPVGEQGHGFFSFVVFFLRDMSSLLSHSPVHPRRWTLPFVVWILTNSTRGVVQRLSFDPYFVLNVLKRHPQLDL